MMQRGSENFDQIKLNKNSQNITSIYHVLHYLSEVIYVQWIFITSTKIS